MEAITRVLNAISGALWDPIVLVLLLGVGIYLLVGLKFMPIRKLGAGIRLLWQGRDPGSTPGGKAKSEDDGEISPFNALMTSLSATIGTGNIAGVATAIALGGPGAVFWMWITALVGMATKFAEAVLAVRFRETDSTGYHIGGPMFYIKNGLGPKGIWLGGAFAFFGGVAAFGIGNTVQSNSMADVMDSTFGIPGWVTGLVIMVLSGAVILGGIKRIAKVAGKLVPIMGVTYIIGGIVVLAVNAGELLDTLGMIFYYAFNPHAAVGGFAGAAVMVAVRFGVARGIFSNEAGLGSAPIAHAAAKTKNPVRQGLIAMLGTFIDTIVVCTITALVILTATVWETGEEGASLTAMSFDAALPGIGNEIVSIALAVFAFTTILGWAFYGEKCCQFLFGTRSIPVYRVIYVLAIPLGAVANLGLIWLLADIFNAMMAIPNLIALALLSPVVFKLAKAYFNGEEVRPGEELDHDNS
ncbi:alanine/glycine:cation symporter family protein [Vreelandella jeotgali]|uniref:alanine/glycine:cation symporter family protein n=1 Tax=Vreelandella jeotgali TaxID=553386 RepID=UPI000347A5D0|nr:sodium:alanine symporter family protein [Halomonas jeotgali]